MTVPYTLTRGWGRGSEKLEDSEEIDGDEPIELSISIPGASTDLALVLAIDVSQIMGLFLKCSRDILLETNSGSAPGNTISLKAGKATIWSTNCGLTNPFTVDITGLFVTLAAGEAATLELRFALDATA